MARLLISKRVDVNFKEVLKEAVKNGDLKKLKFLKNLLESELDFEKFITDALDIAVKKGHKEIVEFIAQSTSLHRVLNKMMALLEMPLSGKSYDKDMAELLIKTKERE